MATINYLQGKTTRHGVATELGIPAVETVTVIQAIEQGLYQYADD